MTGELQSSFNTQMCLPSIDPCSKEGAGRVPCGGVGCGERGSRRMANFAIAGDKLVILALDRLYVLQLGQNVTSKAAMTQ